MKDADQTRPAVGPKAMGRGSEYKILSLGKFMKIGLAVCKCEINFNNYKTTFMFAEMFDAGHFFPFVRGFSLSFSTSSSFSFSARLFTNIGPRCFSRILMVSCRFQWRIMSITWESVLTVTSIHLITERRKKDEKVSHHSIV